MNKSTLTVALRHVFAFLSAVCTFFLLLLAILAGTVLREGYFRRTMEDSGFYEMQYASLVSRLEELAPASGVDESFFGSVIDAGTFRADVSSFIGAARSGGDTSGIRSDTSARVATDVYNKLVGFADEAGYEITDDVKTALTHLSDICAQYYTQNVCDTLLAQGFALLGNYERRTQRVFIPVVLILLAITVLSVFMTVHLSGDRRTAVGALSASGLGLSLMLVVIPVAAYIAGFPRRVYLLSDALTAFAVDYAGGLLAAMLVVGLVIGGCSAVAAYFYRKR